MADRYWVGGTGTWGSSQTTNWSAATGLSFTASCTGTTLTTVGSPALVAGMTVRSSTHVSLGTIVSGAVNTWVVTIGGTYGSQAMSAATVGASVPTAADNVFFDANSNSGTTAFTCTMANTPRVCNDFTASGLDGTMTLAGTSIGLTVSGSLFFPATNFTRSYTGTTIFNATTVGKTITTNSAGFGNSIQINGINGSFILQDALTQTSQFSLFTLTNGTLDLNGKTLTVGAFRTGTGTKDLTFNGGTLICPFTFTTSFSNGSPTNFTTTAGAGVGTISMTAATAKSFVGGGSTFNCTLNQGGAGDLTITGSNTFSNITNTVQPASVLFTAATTSTFSNFSLSGTAGNLITIDSVTAASHTLSKASGTVSSSYLSISNSTATGGATWEAFITNGNVDGGNNTGWIFSNVTYTAIIDETATATDLILRLAAFSSVLAETATATDSVLSQAAFSSVLAETATATDSILGQAAFNSALSETAIATDSPSVAASTFNAPVAETATATDSVISFADFYAALSEAATATDSVISFADFYAALSEAATATDSVISFADFYAALSEAATATDSVISFADFYAALAETATVTDSVLSFADFYAALAETATVTDSVLSLLDFFVFLEEIATATDSPLVAPSTFNAPVVETATATDAVSPPGSIYNAPVSETVTISDLVLALFLWNLIDDSQSIAWQNVNSSPGTVWSLIDDSQSVTWQNINSSPGTTWSPIDTDPDTGWSVTPTVN